MSTFHYHAKEGPKDVQGTVEAQTKQEAIEKIHQMGYLPVRVEAVTSKVKDQASASTSSKSFSRINSKVITLFTWQLASLMKSGVPILHGLQIITQQSENLSFKNIMGNIQNAVKDGKPLSSALADYPRTFSPLYVAMISSGEKGGTLHEILFKVAEYRQKQEEILARLRMALAYPIFMVVVGIGTIVVMFTFVMPRLKGMFEDADQELPFVTQILLNISSGLQQGWPLIFIGAVMIVLILKQGIKKKPQRMALNQLQLRLPLFGEFIRKSELARFCRTLEMLIKSGIPILTALEVATPVLENEIIREELSRSYQELKEGSSLGKSLERSKLFPAFMTNLIVIGEESGRLVDGLGEIANAYTRDTDETMKVMTTLLEPIIILVMGLVVGFIVIAMLLPIFQMNMMAG